MNVLVDLLIILGIVIMVILASMDSGNVDELLHTQSDPYKEGK